MRFFEWANQHDHGVLKRVADASGIDYPQVHSYYSERCIPLGRNAVRLLEAIMRVDKHADVTLADLITARVGKMPAKRVSKRAELAAKRRPKRAKRRRTSEARA